MEEELDFFQRGNLCEVNGEEYECEYEEVVVSPYGGRSVNTKTTSTPNRNVSAKVLNYLGSVSMLKNPTKAGSNAKVWLMQTLLNELNYRLDPIDGLFGPKTDEQVRKFQADNGLIVDGDVGQATWSELIYWGRNRITNGKIGNQDFADAAAKLNVENAAIRAVTEVEAAGAGFVFSNHPKILFESHVFNSQLRKLKIDTTAYNDTDILNSSWDEGKKHYVGGVGEFARLQKARRIKKGAGATEAAKIAEAAEASASWGLFQIMGFNHKACGCETVSDFVKRMCASESEQLKLFLAFIQSNNLLQYLQNKEWAKFAYRYNGSSYAKNQYHTKLQQAYEKYKRLGY